MIECLANVSCIVTDVCIDTFLSFAFAVSQITLQYINDISLCCSLPYVWLVHMILQTVRLHKCHITVTLYLFAFVLGMCSFCFFCGQHCIFQSLFLEAESTFFSSFFMLSDCFLHLVASTVQLNKSLACINDIHIFPNTLAFISVFNQLDAQNLFHNKFYFVPLHVSSTCARNM